MDSFSTTKAPLAIILALVGAALVGLAHSALALAQTPDTSTDTSLPQVAPSPGAAAHPGGHAAHAMISASNPLAVAAGLEVLRRGGSAIDAAVAVQAVLGLVEPQSSGLGGGAFLLFYDAQTRRVTAYDGREVAPAGASPDQFLRADGKPLSFAEAVLGGTATGVPGAIAMLDLAQRQHGRLPWASLFGAGERLARQGFPVSVRLAAMVVGDEPQATAPDVIAYFYHRDGTPVASGETVRNPAYARSLAAIAARRSAGLLAGPIARDIIARLHEGPRPSPMTLADLAAYRPHAGPALCRPYRALTICTPQAPSGGPALQEALGLLARTDIASRGPRDARAWLAFAEASRLAYADRDHYIGDPAFVSVPVAGLLSPDYLDARAALIGPRAAASVTWGTPAKAPTPAPDKTIEPGGTTHVVIVDRHGNVVSMTTTVEAYFGSGRMVDGFFLNNQLTDFSFSPRDPDGAAAANALAPGKRPRSSMAPVIALDGAGRFRAALGSPGGPSILAYNLKGVVALLDWHLPPQKVVMLPNLVAHGGSVSSDRFPPTLTRELGALGVTLDASRGERSSLQLVLRRADGSYEGGADPRREGVARGF